MQRVQGSRIGEGFSEGLSEPVVDIWTEGALRLLQEEQEQEQAQEQAQAQAARKAAKKAKKTRADDAMLFHSYVREQLQSCGFASWLQGLTEDTLVEHRGSTNKLYQFFTDGQGDNVGVEHLTQASRMTNLFSEAQIERLKVAVERRGGACEPTPAVVVNTVPDECAEHVESQRALKLPNGTSVVVQGKTWVVQSIQCRKDGNHEVHLVNGREKCAVGLETITKQPCEFEDFDQFAAAVHAQHGYEIDDLKQMPQVRVLILC